MNLTARKYLINAAKFGVVIIAIGYLLKNDKLNISSINITSKRFFYLLPALLLIIAPSIAAILRWSLLLKGLNTPLPLATVFRLGFIGLFFNSFLLGSFGGDIVKIGYIVKETNKRSAAVASILMDRVIGLFGLILVGSIAIAENWQEVIATPSLHLLALALFTVLAGAGLGLFTAFIVLLLDRRPALSLVLLLLIAQFIYQHFSTPAAMKSALQNHIQVAITFDLLMATFIGIFLPGMLPGRGLHNRMQKFLPLGIGKKIISFTDALLAYRKCPAIMGICLLISVAIHTMVVGGIFMVGFAIGNDATVAQVFFAGPPTLVANVMPVPMGGLGVGENCFEALLALCRNADTNKAVVGGALIFLSWRVLMNLFFIISGFPFYLRGKKEIKELKEYLEKSGENQ